MVFDWLVIYKKGEFDVNRCGNLYNSKADFYVSKQGSYCFTSIAVIHERSSYCSRSTAGIALATRKLLFLDYGSHSFGTRKQLS